MQRKDRNTGVSEGRSFLVEGMASAKAPRLEQAYRVHGAGPGEWHLAGHSMDVDILLCALEAFGGVRAEGCCDLVEKHPAQG